MAQRTDLIRIDFQANARGANAAIESIRVKCDECNATVTRLKDELNTGIRANLPADQIERLRQQLNGARKEAKQFDSAYKELVKGMRTLDQGIKAFNDGTLGEMSQAFQKALFNAAKLTRMRLNPLAESYKKDKEELTALMDASQQYYARLQADSAMVIKTIKEGGKVSRQAINDELTAHRELLQVLSEDDAGYQRTIRNIAILEQRQRELGGNYAYIRQNLQDTKKVSDETLRSMYAELEKTNQEGKVTQDIIRQNAAAMREIRAEQARRVQNVLGGDLGKQSEGSIRSAIANAKELMTTYGSTSRKAQELAAQIVNAEEHLKQHGIEGERAARKEAEAVQLLADKHKMMADRMSNLRNLSASGLAETQKYWQAQMDGATKSSKAYREAERNLKAINAEMERQRTAQLQTSAGKINRKNLSTLSEQEIQTSIAAAKQLAASMKPTEDGYKRLVDNILRAEEHVKQFGLEGERSARQASQQMQTMVDRMGKLASLSDGALAETKKFWETQLVGAERGSAEAQKYEAHIQAIVAEQERLAAEQTKTAAQGIYGDKMTMSEGAIRKAIEAAKQYQQTLAATNPEYKRLTTAIVDAEDHIKKYGLEAERAARKEIEAAKKAADERKNTDQLMENQLRRGTALTETALKAQQQYWQRLIDDPKTAATSLSQYETNLARVKRLQDAMVKNRIANEGAMALGFFQRGDYKDASASQIQEQAKALKTYRDSLPRSTDAKTIAEIDELLVKAGQAAQKAAAETMSFKQAMQIGAQAGSGSFKGTVEQLTQAKKALEDMSAKAVKGGFAWRRMQEGIQSIELELKNVGHISKEVQAVLDAPKGKSFNALKQAVEQGRAALNNMDRTTKEGQRQFDELAKKIKAADFEMKQLAGTAKGSATAFDKAWSRLKTYITLYMGAAVAIQKITATMGDVLTLSDKMGEVRKTTGFTADEVGRLSDNLRKLDTRTTLTDLMGMASIAGSIGLKTQEEVEGFTIAANKLTVALPELGQEAARTLMKIADATGDLKKNGGDVEDTLERVGSTIIALRANSAAASGPITDFVSRVGAVGAQAGISIDQIAALGATVDALGGRVEMSATALSRMIPAIKNNTFAVAKAIGVAENELKKMTGMEQMVTIFRALHDSVKGFDMTTEGGMNAAAESIENMLGNSVEMQEVMKELNQQGARAGIVFGLLSQNVDKLEELLGTASEAYSKNIALQREYDTMNETAAAKWERLKNQIEEAFVGDQIQRFLGSLIDILRGLVNLLTGNVGPALRMVTVLLHTFLVYWATLKIGLGEAIFVKAAEGFKAMGSGLMGLIDKTKAYIFYSKALRNAQLAEAAASTAAEKAITAQSVATIKAKMAQEGLNKAMIANIWTAVAAAVAMLVYAMYNYIDSLKEESREAAKFQAELDKEQQKVNKLTDSIGEARVKIEDANKTVEEARKKLEEAKKATDGTTESSQRLKKAEEELAIAEKRKKELMDEHKRLITEFNTQYSKYLGFMLSEVSSNLELARARDLVNSKLRETLTLKRQEAALERVEKTMGGERDEAFSDLDMALGSVYKHGYRQKTDPATKARVKADITRLANTAKSEGEFKNRLRTILNAYGIAGDSYAIQKTALRYYKRQAEIREANSRVEEQFGAERAVDRQLSQNDFVQSVNASFINYNNKVASYRKATGAKKAKAAAALLQAMDTLEDMQSTSSGYFDMNNPNEAREYARRLKELNEWRGTVSRNELLNAAGSLYKPRQRMAGDSNNFTPSGSFTGGAGSNLYGTYDKVTSPYSEWSGDDLVNRRKEMLERVRALANGADVQKVLSEDARFISDAVRKNIKTTEQAIEWYNTERLKIQDALHAKHLTNTGDWNDPKKSKKRTRQISKMVQDEMKYYLDELDAYYTERKAKIQEAQNDGEISEAEARNRTLANDAEWQQRRGELQLLYTKRRSEVTQQEADAIYDIISERTGDTTDFIKADIAQTIQFILDVGTKSKAAMDRINGDLELSAEKSFLRQRNAIGQHLKAIQDIIDKESPYNGIAEGLRQNLATMEILLADIEKEEERTVDREIERTMFILEQSTKGYSLTWEELMREMAEKGWQAWADAIQADPQMQERLMHQTYRVFEKMQDAIRKEASQIKKDAELMWNNILLPGGDGKTTVKDAFEQILGALGIQEGRVSRANSLIGAGQASERVADRLAIQQMKVQLAMQRYQYDLVRKTALEKINSLRREAEADEKLNNMEDARFKRMQAQNAEMALNLATRKEQTEELKQQEAIIAKTEESEARLYKELRSLADLLATSLQSVLEAANAGDAEYYNELAKLNLTGKGGPGAGTYVVIENAGTSNAEAHYEYLDERQALERQRDIERQNAQAEAWKKVMDDINQRISDTITDQMNALLQDAATRENTAKLEENTSKLEEDSGREAENTNALDVNSDALNTNTGAVQELAAQLAKGIRIDTSGNAGGGDSGTTTPGDDIDDIIQGIADGRINTFDASSDLTSLGSILYSSRNLNSEGEGEQGSIDEATVIGHRKGSSTSDAETQNKLENDKKEIKSEEDKDEKMADSAQSAFAKMTQAANLYGTAYQVMSNDNLSATQKFLLFAVQAAGNAAIAMLTTNLATAEGEKATKLPGILGEAASKLGPIAGPIAFAAMSALLGGLMGLAVSKVAKSKQTVSQATGVSVGAGRLSTGMLTYAEGNVNEFTDPRSLTEGRSYNVAAADGKTYRARYMGTNPKTHLTNGPEFHLVGEAGREAIIDAKTTRLLQMDDTGIWRSIQTLYNGGSRGLSAVRRRGRGVRAFAEGNLEEFDAVDSIDAIGEVGSGLSAEQTLALQASIDRNSDVLERALREGFKGVFNIYGKGGLVDSYDTGKKAVTRHGERY